MTSEEFLQNTERKLAGALAKLPEVIGGEVVHFTNDNFDRQSYASEPWQPRKATPWGKKKRSEKSLLVDTGQLKQSVRIDRITEHSVTVMAGGPDAPYAKVHNEGFHGLVEQTVSPHFRKGKNGKDIYVKEHHRTILQNIPKFNH